MNGTTGPRPGPGPLRPDDPDIQQGTEDAPFPAPEPTGGETPEPHVQPPDPDAAEEYAEAVGVDPTHDEVDKYLEIAGEEPVGEYRPLDEQ